MISTLRGIDISAKCSKQIFYACTRAKNSDFAATSRLYPIQCKIAFTDKIQTFIIKKCSEYKHNTELTKITNKAWFQSHMRTWFLKRIIFLNTFICGGNKRSRIRKQTSTLEPQSYLRSMYYLFEPPGFKGLNKLFQINFQI